MRLLDPFFSVFLSRCKSQETFAHNLCLRVTIKIQESRKIPAITNLGFFSAALIKPIHADLLLINFVRRKGRVCIFATQVSPHFQGFSSEPERRETPAALDPTKLWETDSSPLRDNHNCVSRLDNSVRLQKHGAQMATTVSLLRPLWGRE